jgi:hypothetical protein
MRGLAVACALAAPTLGSAGWIGGVYYVKGVECDVTATGIGSIKQTPQSMSCAISPPATDTRIVGLALCENPGGNHPPGLQPAAIDSFATTEQLDQKNVDRNGKAFKILTAMPTADQLAALITACPNTNYVVTDFVPCGFQTTVNLIDDTTGAILQTESYSCSLDSCLTLGWDKTTQMPEKRQYTCTPLP